MRKLFVIFAASAALCAPLVAQAGTDQGLVRIAYEQGRQAPLSQIIAQIARTTPGRHLNTTPGQSNGRAVYFVQWQMANGSVVVFVVDAESGQIIGRQGG
jgi:uncharacterized membrane protein YkoI